MSDFTIGELSAIQAGLILFQVEVQEQMHNRSDHGAELTQLLREVQSARDKIVADIRDLGGTYR